jgi:hypothetical protein
MHHICQQGSLNTLLVCVCDHVQAWQQAQVELAMRGVQGVKGTACEGKAFDITFRCGTGWHVLQFFVYHHL